MFRQEVCWETNGGVGKDVFLWRRGGSFAFEESDVLAVDELRPPSVVDGDRAVKDVIFAEGSDESW